MKGEGQINPSDEQIDDLLYFVQEWLDEHIVNHREVLRNGVRQWCAKVNKPPCPVDWAKIGSGFDWCAVDADGEVCVYSGEPWRNEVNCEWDSVGFVANADKIEIPLGLDWRLCKWQRPADN